MTAFLVTSHYTLELLNNNVLGHLTVIVTTKSRFSIELFECSVVDGGVGGRGRRMEFELAREAFTNN